MASPPPAQWGAGWVKYRRFSELILVSAAGHFVFALAYGFYLGQWPIAAVLGLPATLVLGLSLCSSPGWRLLASACAATCCCWAT